MWFLFAERIDTWWRKILGANVTDNCWHKNVRMNKEDFFELTGLLEPIIRPKGNSPNYRQLTTEKKLAIMLYYGKGTSSLRMTTNTFEVHQCTVSSFFFKIFFCTWRLAIFCHFEFYFYLNFSPEHAEI